MHFPFLSFLSLLVFLSHQNIWHAKQAYNQKLSRPNPFCSHNKLCSDLKYIREVLFNTWWNHNETQLKDIRTNNSNYTHRAKMFLSWKYFKKDSHIYPYMKYVNFNFKSIVPASKFALYLFVRSLSMNADTLRWDKLSSSFWKKRNISVRAVNFWMQQLYLHWVMSLCHLLS